MFLLVLVNVIAQAQAPANYYDNATGKAGDQLKSALHDIIDDHTTISYQQIWSAFWSTDNKGNNVVWDMYSDGANYTYSYQNGNDQCGEYTLEGDCYNREHSWPQSWFNSENTPTTDLHHIFPTDGFVNAQRGNYPFGEVQSASWTSQNGSKLGTCKSSLGFTGTVFEPIDEYKGDFARAIMYMSVRYYGEDSSWGTSGMTDKSVIKPWAIDMLMNWSDNDPVSQKEIDRNNAVYEIQGNRNPFIDHPEYARAIWDPDWTGVEYIISYASVQHGSITVSATSAQSGTTITLGNTPESGYVLYSYYIYKTGDISTIVYSGTENTFVMPAYDVTVAASFVQPSSYSYVKVTATPNDWNGDYLIVYESGNKAFNGGLETLDATENTINVTISNDTITADNTTNAAKFTIAAIDGGYSIKAANGKYIGNASSNNGLTVNDNPMLNTVSMGEGGINIVGSGGTYLRYNANSGQERFRYFKSSTYTSQQAIQLYHKTSSSSTPTHSINYYPNGGDGSMSTQTVEEMVPTALTDNIFTRNGFVFDSWNTAADGTGTTYFDGATVTLLNDLTLYAQWKQLFTISLEDSSHGSVTASQAQAVEGDLITLSVTPDQGYELYALTVIDSYSNTISVTDNQFEMPAANVTVSATFTPKETFTTHYYLVTSTDQLEANRKYLIVNMSNGKALSKTQNSNNRGAESVTITNNTIESIGNNVCELTLGQSDNYWTLYDSIAGGFLYAASKTSNQLKTQTSLNDNGKWAIAIDESGNATLTAQGENTRNLLKYNNSNNIFSCYGSTSSVQNVSLFVRTDTFVLDIEGYTGNGGWYTISTPFAEFAPAQIATGDYDLYAYAENNGQEWINYKANPTSFPTSASRGYLYAHNPSTTLRMTGTLNSGDYSKTVELSYENTEEGLRGFNLLGNPTTHDITFNKTDNVSDGYYYLSNSETWQYEPTNSVPVGRGFLVKANATGQSVTLNPQSRGNNAEASYLCIAIDDDKTYVKMDEGTSMPLLDFRGKTSNVYLTRDGKPYIMLTKDDAIDLCFNPTLHGKHTLTFSATPNSQLPTPNYLHLVDRLTGADIDLIATPSYSFESSNSDYPSRFQLRFSPNNDSESGDSFAYISNGQLIITGEGTLQIVDMTGRVLITKQLPTPNSQLSTSTFPSGVYVLKLITSEATRTQKIIIDK